MIPVLGRSPREGNRNLLQYSCLGNPMDRGAWKAAVHGVTKSRTKLRRLTKQQQQGEPQAKVKAEIRMMHQVFCRKFSLSSQVQGFVQKRSH